MDDCRNCQGVAERMTRYVDGALPAGEHEAVERHLDACPPCRDEAAEEAAARTVLRERAEQLRHASGAPQVPADLRQRCRQAALAECRSRGSAVRARLAPALVAASLVMATAIALVWVTGQRSGSALAAQLTEDHADCFSRLPADAVALDAAQVAADLRERYGWNVHVPSPAEVPGMQLVEGRRCLLLTHGGVPHLLYRVNGEDMSLFVFPGEDHDAADLTTPGGERVEVWSSGGNSFALVSSRNRDAGLEQALAFVRQDAE
jgi:anti-sigma factor RsiW